MFSIKKLDLLISIYIFCIAVSELMGGKTFNLEKALFSLPVPIPLQVFSFLRWITFDTFQYLNASVALFIVPIIFSINDVITEVYGAERMRSIIRSGLVVIVLIFLYSLIATSLPSSKRFMLTEKAYETIFNITARISFASLTAFAISDFMDVAIFDKLRKSLGKKGLWLRNNASNIMSQLVDSVVFIFLAFYAFDKGFGNNVSFLISLIIPYWLLKCFMSIIETPFVYLGVNWLKGEKE